MKCLNAVLTVTSQLNIFFVKSVPNYGINSNLLGRGLESDDLERH